MQSSLTNGLLMMLTRLPHLAIELSAIVIAIVRWRRHPVVSLLVVVASILGLLVTAAFAVVPMAIESSGLSREAMPLAFGGLSLLGDVSLAVLVGAVFSDRPVEPKRPVDYGSAP